MITVGLFFALTLAAVSAGYASSSSGGAGLYNSNSNDGQSYGSKYPYSNQYTGYASAGGGSANAFPFYQPVAPFASPYEFQAAFQNYFNQLSALNANLYNQQLAHQAAVFNSIRNQAYGGAAAAGAGAGAGVGSFGSTGPSGTYGGTYGGGASYAPNFASAGGFVGNGGYQQQYANVYPANPANPNLDSRFGGDDAGAGVTHSQGRPGFVGISSFSSSSDINGVKQRESATSVNNNGKVTTYHVRN